METMDVQQKTKSTGNGGKLSTEQMHAKYGLPLGGLRWKIFIAKNDPRLRATFLRVGRRIYWDEEKFLRYLEEMNEESLKREGSK